MIELKIPFELYKKGGVININYKTNTSIEESGFDILEHIKGKFDLNMCIGYPTIHAKVVDFEATGYRRYCGWIQILELDYYNDSDLVNPEYKKVCIDKSPNMNLPFFSMGYPAELYDAPCNNIGGGFKLSWKARTYLVTCPEEFNYNTISFIAGFKWGYDEYNDKKVDIHEICEIKCEDWIKDIEVLNKEFNQFKYE